MNAAVRLLVFLLLLVPEATLSHGAWGKPQQCGDHKQWRRGVHQQQVRPTPWQPCMCCTSSAACSPTLLPGQYSEKYSSQASHVIGQDHPATCSPCQACAFCSFVRTCPVLADAARALWRADMCLAFVRAATSPQGRPAFPSSALSAVSLYLRLKMCITRLCSICSSNLSAASSASAAV